jgi:hypothetical protein
MGGVDHSDHYCEKYSFIWKSLKWWRKLSFWCLEVCIVNSYILYSSHKACMGEKQMSHVKYQGTLVEHLVGDVRSNRKRSFPGSAEREDRLNTLHNFLYHYEKKKHKDCSLCSNHKVKGARKETVLLQDLYKSGQVSWRMFSKISHSKELQKVLV